MAKHKTTQPTQIEFDLSAALAGKEDGMRRAADNASREWKDEMYELVLEVARRSVYFTSDDVFALALERGVAPTHENRAFGPIMMRAAREDVCEKAKVAAVNSRRKSLHASPRAVWRSLVHEGVNDGTSPLDAIANMESEIVRIERILAKKGTPGPRQLARLIKAIRNSGVVQAAA